MQVRGRLFSECLKGIVAISTNTLPILALEKPGRMPKVKQKKGAKGAAGDNEKRGVWSRRQRLLMAQLYRVSFACDLW